MSNDWDKDALDRMRIAADSLGYERVAGKRPPVGTVLTMRNATKAVGAAAMAAAALVLAG